MANSSPQRQRARLLTVILLLAVTIASFWPSLRFDFVNLDDPKNLVRQRESPVYSQPLLERIWTEGYLGHYQPLVRMTWWTLVPFARKPIEPGSAEPGPTLKWAHPSVAGLDPSVFHGLNLALHAANSALLLLLLFQAGISPLPAFAGALIFSLHPAQAESVGWVSVLGGLLASFWTLLTLLLFERYLLERRSRDYLLTLGAALLAFFSKPVAIALPVMLWVRARAQRRRPGRALTPGVTAPFWVLSVIFMAIASSVQDATLMSFKVDVLDRPWVAIDALAFYLERLVKVGSWGTVDFGRYPEWVLSQPSIHLNLLVFAAVVLGVAWAMRDLLRRSQEGQRSLALLLGPLIPVLGLAPFYNQTVSTVADRYLYLPLAGVAFAVAWGLERLARRLTESSWNHAAKALPAIVIAAALAMIPVTRTQLEVWKDTPMLFHSTLQKNPRSWLAYNNLASHAEVRGDREEAIAHYLRASELQFRGEALLRAGVMLVELGRITEARQVFENLVSKEPRNALGLNNLAFCLSELGERATALEMARRALEVNPRLPEAQAMVRDLSR